MSDLRDELSYLDNTVGPLDGAMETIAAAVEIFGAHYVEAACVAHRIAAPLPLADRADLEAQ
jgi:hypothetical protein